MEKHKKIIISFMLGLMLLSCWPLGSIALEEIDENELELKIQRIENDDEEVRSDSQKNDERLFNKYTREALKKSEQKAAEEQAEVAASLFTSAAISLTPHNVNKLFSTNSANAFSKGDTSSQETQPTESFFSLSSVLVGVGIVALGTIGIYFYMKSREKHGK